MNTLCKTPKGTIGAFWWRNGVAVGIYGEGNFASFEYDPKKKELRLMLCDAEMKRQGFKLVHCNEKWEEITK